MPNYGPLEIFRVIHEEDGHPTEAMRPADIDPRLMGSFEPPEVRESAGKLIRFLQSLGRWSGFISEELRYYYKGQGWDPDVAFVGLIGGWYADDGPGGNGEWRQPLDIFLVQAESGTYFVTDRFIEWCTRSLRPSRQAA